MKIFIKHIPMARYPWKVYVEMTIGKGECMSGNQTYQGAKKIFIDGKDASEAEIRAKINTMYRTTDNNKKYLTWPNKE